MVWQRHRSPPLPPPPTPPHPVPNPSLCAGRWCGKSSADLHLPHTQTHPVPNPSLTVRRSVVAKAALPSATSGWCSVRYSSLDTRARQVALRSMPAALMPSVSSMRVPYLS